MVGLSVNREETANRTRDRSDLAAQRAVLQSEWDRHFVAAVQLSDLRQLDHRTPFGRPNSTLFRSILGQRNIGAPTSVVEEQNESMRAVMILLAPCTSPTLPA